MHFSGETRISFKRIFKVRGPSIASIFVFFLAQSPSSAAPDKPNPAIVFVSQAKAIELFDVLTYPARVVPKINSAVISETDGVVTKVLTPLGQRVKRGQRLLTITHTDPVYQFAPMEVTSPSTGVVSLVEVTEGSHVTKNQKLLAVTDPSQVNLIIEVPAQDLALLSQGAVGEFRMDGRLDPNEASTPVKVRGISAFVDPATGTATCELEIQKKNKSTAHIPPGVLGQVSFKAGIRKGISLPDHAIFFKGSETFVRLLENGKAKQVAVRLGRKQRGQVEVLSGVPDGSSVIERTSRFVGDGEEVTVQGTESKKPEAKK